VGLTVGFATYFVPDLNLDHEVAEVWDADQARWRLVDPELGDNHVDPSDGAWVDPLDVPRDRFRSPGRHGRHAAGPTQTRRRSWSIRGLTSRPREAGRTCATTLSMTSPPSTGLRCSSGGDTAFDELRHLYAEPGLRVPRQVVSYSPASEASRRVDVAASP
jgi:hypothetical protein